MSDPIPALVAVSYRLPWSRFGTHEPWQFATINATKFEDDGAGNPTAWAIREQGVVLTKENEWEYEPSPSSRDDEFFQRARYATVQEAYEQARKHFEP